jgi:acyl-CoA thioester hydrolase
MPIADDLAAFPVVLPWPVQWADQDLFGHVNNAVYFRWYESARIAYLERIGVQSLREGQTVGPILAAIKCNFRRQLTYPDTVEIGARITHIGRTSLTMTHVMRSRRQGAVVADGEGTIVMFDYDAGHPAPVSDAIRQAIAKLEGHAL